MMTQKAEATPPTEFLVSTQYSRSIVTVKIIVKNHYQRIIVTLPGNFFAEEHIHELGHSIGGDSVIFYSCLNLHNVAEH